jgi:hypothetical protein
MRGLPAYGVQRRANSLGVLRQGTVSGGAAPSPLLTDLVSYWKLDEGSGTRVDSHGSNNLTDNGSVGSATGKVGNAADFDGTNFLELNPGLSIPSDISVSFWCYPNAGYGTLSFPGMVAQTLDWGRIFVSSSGVAQARVRQSNGVERVASTITTVSTTAWSHFVLVANSSTGVVALYINNFVVGSITYDGTLNQGNDTLKIGRQSSSFFDGRIDEVGIWNRALTPAEIATLYNSGASLTYPF